MELPSYSKFKGEQIEQCKVCIEKTCCDLENANWSLHVLGRICL